MTTTSSATSSSSTASGANTVSTSSSTVVSKPNVTSVLGAGSGIDIQSLATAMTDAQRTPAKAAIDKHISASTANISGYSAIKYVLGNLQTAFSALKDQSSYNSLTPVNSQPAALSVSAGVTAALGTHSVEITQLATAQRSVSAVGFASGAALINGGTPFNVLLSLHGAAPTSIAVTDPTPRGVAYAINQAGLGVNAQLVNTGDANAPYKILLTGATGATNDFTLVGQAMPGTPTFITNQGLADPINPVTESTRISFGSGLAAGESMTVGGLTYTATSALSAADLAAAFSSLSAGATTGAGTGKGIYSGSLSGFSTGTVGLGNSVTATSSTPGSNVADLKIAGAAPSNGSPSVTTVSGNATVTEAATVAFANGLSAGQSVTVAGLKFTATAAVTASQLASAFGALDVGATTGSGTSLGTYSGTLAGFSTGASTGSSFTATSTIPNSDVPDLTISPSHLQSISGLDFSTMTQSAANATLIVDGVPITASSNQVTDALPGVTLSLTAKTTAGVPANLSFTRDMTAITAKLQAVVTAYNDAVTMLGVVSDPSSTVADYGASLVGNSIVSQVRNQIRSLITDGAAANAPASGGITALRDLGATIDSKGVLTLDTTKLNTTLSANFDNVVTLLSANQENLSIYSRLDGGVAGDAVKKLTSMLSSTGAISTNSVNASTKITNYQKDLAKLETRMTALKARYLSQFAAMDTIVGQSTTLRNSMATSYAGMMSMYTNKA
ncbi:MAG: flagellar filament capping protein FliD [Rhodoferax sp.]